MRRLSPTALRLVLSGTTLFLLLFAAGAGVISFLLLRAGYGFVVWGVLPFLALVVAALVLVVGIWYLTGGKLPGRGRSGDEEPDEDSGRGARREGPRRGDDV